MARRAKRSSKLGVSREMGAGALGLISILLIGLLLGGGGTPAPETELLVQLACIAIYAGLLYSDVGGGARLTAVFARDRQIAWLWCGLILLFLIHLMPLPPSIWSALPGREAIAQNLIAFDALPWLPISIAPAMTFAALLSLIPPTIAYAVGSATRPGQRDWIIYTLLAFAFITVGLQVLQATGGFFPYAQTEIAFTAGFQANRNAQGDILVIILIALAMRPRATGHHLRFHAIQAVAAAFLVFAVVLTGSRAGLGMALLTSLLFVGRAWFDVPRNARKKFVAAVGAAAALSIVALVLLFQNPVAQRTLERFTYDDDQRFSLIWPDAIYAAQAYLPVGAGLGAFIPAFRIYESQEVISAQFANRAHNEILEILIEAGPVGLLLVLALMAMLIIRATGSIRARKFPDHIRRGVFLLAVVVLMFMHSMLDYPIRSMSIAIIIALAAGLVSADRSDRLSYATREKNGD